MTNCKVSVSNLSKEQELRKIFQTVLLNSRGSTIHTVFGAFFSMKILILNYNLIVNAKLILT